MIDQSTFEWPEGRKGAVSVTYDDALPCHYETVGPAWEAYGLRATFYATIVRIGKPVNGLMLNPDAWRELADKGHELGNHSLFHPCHSQEDFNWLPDEYDLGGYTALRWLDEMRTANFTLSLLDGKTERTYGNTCCHTEIGTPERQESLEPLIEELFVAARGGYTEQVVDVANINYNALGHFGGDTHDNETDFDTIRHQIDNAVENGGWIIYMIHGVGKDSYALHIGSEEHQRLVDYLGERQDSIWTVPVVTVAKHLKSCDPDLVG